MNLDGLPKQNPAYRLEALDGEVLLYSQDDTRILYCNPSASLIWQLCDGTRTAGEIVATLCAAFPDAAESVPQDVEAALGELEQHGAIEWA